ncbi:MAG: hypothetical protein ACRDQ7_04645 [Haloechinothrix sp.]
MTSTIVVTGAFGAMLAWAGSAVAEAPAMLAQTQSSAAPFGLLGPVGLGAVVLGMAGMVAGYARRRRDAITRAKADRRAAVARAAAARAAQYAHPEDYGSSVPSPSRVPLVEQPTRKLTPVGRSHAA